MNNVPEHLQVFLGDDEVELCDRSCGEPILWGYPVITKVGEEIWAELGKYGLLQYVKDKGAHGLWYLVVRQLTRDEAIKKYGIITSEVFGPRGGWKSITFGEKTFISKSLKP